MNKKGFTLIELLATVVIIGLISYIAFPSLMRVINNNTKTEIEYYGETMISAAKLYIQKEGKDLKEAGKLVSNNSSITIDLTTLQNSDYINKYNKTRKNVSCIDYKQSSTTYTNGVKVILKDKVSNTYEYQYQLSLYDSSKKEIYTKRYNEELKTIKSNTVTITKTY